MTYNVGQRVNMGALLVTTQSHYQAVCRWKDDGSYETKHRYVFKAPTGENFVYSGKWLGNLWGKYVSIVATVKRVEKQYKCVRLARVKITRVGIEERLI